MYAKVKVILIWTIIKVPPNTKTTLIREALTPQTIKEEEAIALTIKEDRITIAITSLIQCLVQPSRR